MEQQNFGGENYQIKTGEQNINLFINNPNQIQRSPTGIPHNLPISGVVQFVGRDDDLNTLHEQLQQGTTVDISAVAGMGGVGKTELALQYALEHLDAQTYLGGICWLRAREPVGTQLISFAQSGLNLQPPDELELADRIQWCWLRWPAGAVLLILDDVQDYQDVKLFLPPAEARFKVVLTSRSTFGPPVRTLKLEVLTEWAALELLRSVLQDNRIDQNLEQAKGLCQWLGYLPLGLELVGRYLAAKPDLSLATMQQRLESKRLEAKALKEAAPEMTATLGVAAAFELSWQELEENAQQLAMLLSVFALAAIPWELVQQCLPEWDEEALEDLRDLCLVKLSLLERTQENTYQLHQLLREFFSAKLRQTEGATDLKQTFCQVLLQVASQIPQNPTRSLIEQVAPAIPHLAEVATHLTDSLSDDELIIPFTRLALFYAGQAAYSEAVQWAERCRQVAVARLGDDHPSVATSLNNLASLYESQGRYSEAEPLHLRSLSIWQQQLGDDHPHVATSLNNLASLYRTQGRYSEAEPLHLRSLSILQQQLGDDHPNTQTGRQNLRYLLQQVIQAGRTAELSNDPTTQALLLQLRGEKPGF